MRDLTKEVQQGKMNGKTVWICHYNQPDLNKKPLRNIPPTKCLVVCNDELPKNKRVYYSKSHFKPIGKNGSVTSRVISPVDNTGYRMSEGNPLNTFKTESDCVSKWNEELQVVHEQLTDRLKNAAQEIEREIIKIEEMRK
tara:strand:- start:283 stop:702 length:420 start_codon:yes stop_codon:yes gene_type:complete